MQEKSLIKKNILHFIDTKGISKYSFYQMTGITRGVLDQNNGMSEENITRFLASFPEVKPEWLITGNGPMNKGETSVQISNPVQAYNEKLENNEECTKCAEKDIRICELKETISVQKDLIYELKKQRYFEDEKDADTAGGAAVG